MITPSWIVLAVSSLLVVLSEGSVESIEDKSLAIVKKTITKRNVEEFSWGLSPPPLPYPQADSAQGFRQFDDGPYTPSRRFFIGNQDLCSSGSCEFFLFCWLTGGLIQGGCGGFLFACCVRRGTLRGSVLLDSLSTLRGSDIEREPKFYGPVVNDPECGQLEGVGLTRRIVGGQDAGFGIVPWQAHIRIGSSRCGGSLIDHYHVVTAGHCVAKARAKQIKVILGEYVLNSDIEPLDSEEFRVESIKIHPKFKYTPQADRYDVAVLTLDRRVKYQPHIVPVCLPEKGEDHLGEFAWAAGWGALQPGSKARPKVLQTVEVPIIDNDVCEGWHKSKGIRVRIYDEMVCAGYKEGGRDSCQGDSGGPLMLEQDGRWFLIGIVSAGYSCAKGGQPGIYHRVAKTADWISYSTN